MLILGREKLDAFARQHASARPWIENWIAETRRLKWRKPQDIRDLFASASFLPGNRVVFNVKGNRYRLEVRIAYESGLVVILRIGTHTEYSQWT